MLSHIMGRNVHLSVIGSDRFLRNRKRCNEYLEIALLQDTELQCRFAVILLIQWMSPY